MNLVTGATGLLGTHLMLELLSRGEEVRALRRSNSDLDIVEKIFRFYHPDKNYFEQIRWVCAELENVETLLDAMVGCTHVYHCAAVVSYHRADRNNMYRSNVDGTANVVNVALEMKIRKLCFVSSIAALGKTNDGEWLDENSDWKDSPFVSHYGITKYLSELEVWRGVQEGLDAIIVNPGVIIGPGDRERSSSSLFQTVDRNFGYFPPGVTGFVAATDVAKAMVDLMQGETTNERFVLVAENLTMKDVFQQIAQSLGSKIPEKPAGTFILQMARIAEWLKEKLLGRKAMVTREMVKNASTKFYYKNEKIANQLNWKFRGISEAIRQGAEFYRNQKW